MEVVFNKEYKEWLFELKQKIAGTQIRIARQANSVLIQFYWDLGKDISVKIEQGKWGSKLIDQLAIDLKKELPGIKGFSRTNLYYIKQFYETFSSVEYQNIFVPQTEGQNKNAIIPQLGGQLPWGHIKVLLSKAKDAKECLFYIQQAKSNDWSRDVLALQIKNNLFARQGKAITNFKNTLSNTMSDLANQTIKDPYVFDFMTMTQPFKEKDIENQLVDHISKFLLELGKGFAYVGRQYHLEIANEDYYIDLLFYHIHLKCYVVIELKNTKFIPEYAGKMNFYLSAVDTLLKDNIDKPTIGIILCRDKNNITTEFALRDFNKPMGVSEFQLVENLPENLKSSLPTIEEIEEGIDI